MKSLGKHWGEKGATLLEHTIAMPLFIVFLLLAIDLLRIAYYQLSLQYALNRGARRCLMSATTCDTQTKAYNAINSELISAGVSVDSGNDFLTVCSQKQYTATGGCAQNSYTLGNPRDVIVFKLEKVVPLISLKVIPGSSTIPYIKLTTTAIGQNEPTYGT